MARGDHIYVKRTGFYTHHGVDVGDDLVIHRSTSDGTKSGSCIRRTTIDEFRDGGLVRVRIYGTRLDPEAAVARAESILGQSGYHLIGDNCEHFATWCVAGDYSSEQVEAAVSSTRVLGLGVAVPSAGMSVVTTLGHGPAFSGPNLISGLARVGGTATAGVLLIGGAAGLATAGGMCLLMPDKPAFSDHERQARRAGRYGAGAGALAGTALGLHTVGTMGVAGYSAVGLTSGFAALGRTVDGGMTAGVAAAIAMPALVAIALGYVLYKFSRPWFEETPSSASGGAPAV